MASPRTESPTDLAFQEVIWKDEMNLSELPLSTLSERTPDGLTNLDFYVTEADGATVRRVSVIPPSDDQLQRLVEVAYPGLLPDVTARPVRRRKGEPAPAVALPPKAAKLLASVRGLPNGTDDDVLLALIQITRKRGFESRRVNFSLYELVKLLGWDDSAKSYDRAIVSLLRWKAVLVTYHDAWRDNSEKRYVSKTFNMLDEVSIFTRQGRRSAAADGQSQLPFSSFAWSEVIFKSFDDGFLKNLDFGVYKGLSGRTAKRMYRFLDKRFGLVNKGRTEPVPVWFDLRDFACGNIGLIGDYEPWKLKQVLAPAIKELEQAGIILPLPADRRYKAEGRGKWKIVFHQNLTPKALPEPAAVAVPASGLIAAMERKGVTRTAAEALAAELPAERIALQLDVLDWWLETARQPAINEPAAWLVKAIRDDYAPPKGYEPKAERERKAQAAAAKRQKAEDAKRRREDAAKREETSLAAAAAAKRTHVENYLSTLAPDARAEFERQAVANASGLHRDHMKGTGLLAETSRRLVIEEAVLRLCPMA